MPESLRIFPAADLLLVQSALSDCPYLPGLQATQEIAVARLAHPFDIHSSEAYQELLDRGFRRMGDMFYRPACATCSECRSLRVPVAAFAPSRSQRRVARRNADVSVAIEPPSDNDEQWRVYAVYQAGQHANHDRDRESFESLMTGSPIDTLQMTYRVGGRLVAVGVVDVCPRGVSSVYFYFDPAESRRSLGVFSALCEIQECRRRGLPYWYVGYWVRDCRKMQYKSQYRPHELLDRDGVWRPATQI
ncbi:MAG: arginyltransferase [Phycisphaerae bacterium]